jgi:hypothetical protein
MAVLLRINSLKAVTDSGVDVVVGVLEFLQDCRHHQRRAPPKVSVWNCQGFGVSVENQDS